MTAPKRIQRRRTNGWRMPAGAVYVGRPTIFGNPWRVGDPSPEHPYDPIDHIEAVELYVAWIEAPEQEWLFRMTQELTGLDLACWCPPDQLCHADVLLEIANTEVPA